MFRLLATGLVTWLIGNAMNVAALLANQGRFPEFAPGSYQGYVDAQVARLPWLGDWLPVGRFWFSPGDLFIYGGLSVVAVAWVRLIAYGLRTGRWHVFVRDIQGD